jgi:hypothetical protein
VASKTDVALGLIQLVALIIPAWAITLQIIVSRVDTENLDPILGLGFVTFGMGCLIGFVYGFRRISIHFVQEFPSFSEAVNFITIGLILFTGLAFIVLIRTFFSNLSPKATNALVIGFTGTIASSYLRRADGIEFLGVGVFWIEYFLISWVIAIMFVSFGLVATIVEHLLKEEEDPMFLDDEPVFAHGSTFYFSLGGAVLCFFGVVGLVLTFIFVLPRFLRALVLEHRFVI